MLKKFLQLLCGNSFLKNKSYNELIYFYSYFDSSTGGASEYGKFIKEYFGNLSQFTKISIFSETDNSGKIKKFIANNIYFNQVLAPFHSRKNNSNKLHLFIKQNIQIFFLIFKFIFSSFFVKDKKKIVIMFHCCFFSTISIYAPLIYLIKNLSRKKIIFVCDFRDRGFTKFININSFHSGISSSKNITHFIESRGLDNFTHIPIPFYRKSSIRKYNLSNYGISSKYIFSTIGINFNKGLHILLEAFSKLKCKDIKLVLCGKDVNNEYILLSDNFKHNLIYLGEVDNDEVRYLMSMSELVIIPSSIEGMSRTGLEAIDVKSKVLIPNNLFELKKNNPSFVINPYSSLNIHAKLKEHLKNKSPSLKYDLTLHDPEAIFHKYSNYFNYLLKSF